ncbi:hypothetical protein BH10PAT3_BH10PAT3_2040 [soil metagenome]
MTGKRAELSAEEMMQNAFIIYAQGVESVDQAQQFDRLGGFGLENSLHKSDAVAHFQRAVNWARWARDSDPTIE